MTSIGVGAFYGCSGLTNIYISANATSIGNYAFSGCSNLTSIVIPDSTTYLGTNLLVDCPALTNVVIPSQFAAKMGTFGLSDELATDLMVNAISQRILAASPTNYGIATKTDLTTVASNATTQAIAQVQASPNSYGLYDATQYEANRITGIAEGTASVTNDPAAYNLYTSNSIADLSLGGAMIQKQGSNAVVTLQLQVSTNLATTPFTDYGAPITNSVPISGSQEFLRVRAN